MPLSDMATPYYILKIEAADSSEKARRIDMQSLDPMPVDISTF
jgi:hypothetical protein